MVMMPDVIKKIYGIFMNNNIRIFLYNNLSISNY